MRALDCNAHVEESFETCDALRQDQLARGFKRGDLSSATFEKILHKNAAPLYHF